MSNPARPVVASNPSSPFGEFQILVDEEVLIDGSAKAMMGILPSGKKAVDAVRLRLSGSA